MRISKNQSINQSSLKKNNTGLILDEIKRARRMVRSELAHILRLSFATVSGIIEDLKRQGFVTIGEEGVSTGGRKPKSVEFLPESRLVVALDFSVKDKLHVSLVTLAYEILNDVWIEVGSANSCEGLFETVQDTYELLINRSQVERSAVIGAGVAVPGRYDETADRIYFCTNALFEGISIRRRLEDRLQMPVSVMNDANLAALGQCTLLVRQDVNFFLLYFTEGIGLGIIHNGMSYPGATGFAGEIGNIKLPLGGDGVKVEEYLNMDGILASYRYFLARGKVVPPEEMFPVDAEEKTILLDKLIEGCNRKSITELQFIRDIGHLLGWLVASLLDLLNPGTIYIGGDIDPIVNCLLPHIRTYVRRNSTVAAVTDVSIQAASVVDLIVKGTGELVYKQWLHATFFNQD